MEIESPLLWGLGVWGLSALGLWGILTAVWLGRLHQRSARRLRAAELIQGLCQLDGQVAGDAGLAGLLVDYVERPGSLTRAERVRARAWFDASRRLHRLLLDIAGKDERVLDRARFLPSMGESIRRGVAPESGEAPNAVRLDPEFLAMIEATRSREKA